jgi:hypothetical protein
MIALKLQVSPTGGYDEHRHIRHACRTPNKKTGLTPVFSNSVKQPLSSGSIPPAPK